MATVPVPAAIPHLHGLPLLGAGLSLQHDRLAFLRRASRAGGEIVHFRLGPREGYFVNSSDLVQEVLVAHAPEVEKAFRLLRGSPLYLLGNGLLTSMNASHKRQRKLIAPAFQPRHIVAYAGCMTSYAEQIQALWADGATIDVAHEMRRLTLWIVGKTLFDADVLAQADDVGAALTTVMRDSNARRHALVQVPATWPTPRNRRLRAARARLDATVYRIIAARRQSGEDRGDLLSVLLRTQDQDDGGFMTDQQVRDEAMTLFLAGHETTANALSWTLYLLAQHPEVYAHVRAEVDLVLQGRTPTVADLAHLPYTLQVLKEALRLYPPAYILLRYVAEPLTLGGHRLPQGAVVVISPYTLHRRPDYFPEPERFDPSRFVPEVEGRLPRYAYLPFGAGPRACIGNHFALMEAHLVLATLAQRVTFELVRGQRVATEPLVTLRPKHGIRMIVRRRKDATAA